MLHFDGMQFSYWCCCCCFYFYSRTDAMRFVEWNSCNIWLSNEIRENTRNFDIVEKVHALNLHNILILSWIVCTVYRMTYFVDAIVKCGPSHVNTFARSFWPITWCHHFFFSIPFFSSSSSFSSFFVNENLNLPKWNPAIPSRLIYVMAFPIYRRIDSNDVKPVENARSTFSWLQTSRFTNIINEFFCSMLERRRATQKKN